MARFKLYIMCLATLMTYMAFTPSNSNAAPHLIEIAKRSTEPEPSTLTLNGSHAAPITGHSGSSRPQIPTAKIVRREKRGLGAVFGAIGRFGSAAMRPVSSAFGKLGNVFRTHGKTVAINAAPPAVLAVAGHAYQGATRNKNATNV